MIAFDSSLVAFRSAEGVEFLRLALRRSATITVGDEFFCCASLGFAFG